MIQVALEPMDFERLGRVRGEVLAMENEVLRARVRVLEAELAQSKAEIAMRGAADAFDTELGKLAKQYAFDVNAGWRPHAATFSLIRVDGAGNQG